MILIRGLSRHPLGSWEKSVLLRSAYLYGSWYRFARTFFWLCSRLPLLIIRGVRRELGPKGNTACFPSVHSSIALLAQLRGSSSLLFGVVQCSSWFWCTLAMIDRMCVLLEEEQKSQGISFVGWWELRFVKSIALRWSSATLWSFFKCFFGHSLQYTPLGFALSLRGGKELCWVFGSQELSSTRVCLLFRR